jgi:hypothetical protein
MPRAGFETAIPMFERPKTVLALDCAAIDTGEKVIVWSKTYPPFMEPEGSLPCSENLPQDPIVNQVKPVHIFTPYFVLNFNIPAIYLITIRNFLILVPSIAFISCMGVELGLSP